MLPWIVSLASSIQTDLSGAEWVSGAEHPVADSSRGTWKPQCG
jgi:hypothetical protein